MTWRNAGPDAWRRMVRDNATPDRNTDWQAVYDYHQPVDEPSDLVVCRCRKWWPCWSRARAYEQLVLSGRDPGHL